MQSIQTRLSSPGDLRAHYSRVRTGTEELCRPLKIEDYIPQPAVDVSPPKWNIAHTTWFFEQMVLKRFAGDYKVFDPSFGFLFNSYYNSIGDRTERDHRGDLSRPGVDEVFAYRKYVDQGIAELLNSGGDNTELNELIILGLNHEQQHQELFLTDLKFTFGCNPLFPAYRKEYYPEEKVESGKSGFVEIDSGIYEVGYGGTGFCFDNELDRHKVYLNNFSISNRLVTNLEFLEFVDDGGYKDFRYWHSEGWDWIRQNKIESPLHWHQKNNEWHHFTMGGLRKLPFNAPVCHVSFYEAAAFAEWKEMRLPTEFEWEAATASLW
jgi:ergothioneine biosynthesis protein EgtB